MSVPASAPARGVLVADGEPAVCRMVEHALQTAGYQAWSASTAEQALALFHQHRGEIQLALLDLRMAGMEQYQTLDALAALDPRLRFCLMTTAVCHMPDLLLPDGRRYRVLEKPFRLADLIRTVEEVLAPAPDGPP